MNLTWLVRVVLQLPVAALHGWLLLDKDKNIVDLLSLSHRQR